ncbi:MAG: hypothetical protein QM800_07655 [Paludibacter sp.]
MAQFIATEHDRHCETALPKATQRMPSPSVRISTLLSPRQCGSCTSQEASGAEYAAPP